MRSLLSIIILLGASWNALGVVLFEASENTTPVEQGWAYLTNPLFDAASVQTVTDGVLSLNTFAVPSEQAGFFSKIDTLFEHELSPTLDLSAGPYVVEWSLQLARSLNIPDTEPSVVGERNRGGFSVIAISENLTGIEFQFQAERVIALDDTSSAFSIGESVELDLSQSLVEFELIMAQDGYQLFANGSQLVSGRLRDYSDIATPPFDFPYTTPSFFFFGDNTGRGAAESRMTFFSVSQLGDCSHDNVISVDDLSCVHSISARDAVLAAIGSLPGDFDGDGEVGFVDFLILSDQFGTSSDRYTDGNIDLTNGVGFEDFLQLSLNFGRRAEAFALVPEPRRFAIMRLGLLAVLTSRCSRRRSHP